jgi:hypothetical protein
VYDIGDGPRLNTISKDRWRSADACADWYRYDVARSSNSSATASNVEKQKQLHLFRTSTSPPSTNPRWNSEDPAPRNLTQSVNQPHALTTTYLHCIMSSTLGSHIFTITMSLHPPPRPRHQVTSTYLYIDSPTARNSQRNTPKCRTLA